jgi:seryl-tRNA synthetase
LCLADLESGAAVAGNRGYYLLGEGVMLNQVRE